MLVDTLVLGTTLCNNPVKRSPKENTNDWNTRSDYYPILSIMSLTLFRSCLGSADNLLRCWCPVASTNFFQYEVENFRVLHPGKDGWEPLVTALPLDPTLDNATEDIDWICPRFAELTPDQGAPWIALAGAKQRPVIAYDKSTLF